MGPNQLPVALGVTHRELEWHLQEVVAGKGSRQRVILRGISGKASSGTVTAILGPSGAGKTTLLECLSLRHRGFRGALRLDGLPLTPSYFTTTAVVYQKQVFAGSLTVREMLTFHAVARMANSCSREAIQQRIEQVLREACLLKCADTVIGGVDPIMAHKGISGGEQRRLAIALELLRCPAIVMMDEPTSGLDSVTAESVMRTVSNLAMGGRIVVASLHCPSTMVMDRIHQVVLLTHRGTLAYQGTKEDAVQFFTALGYHQPKGISDADYFLKVLSRPDPADDPNDTSVSSRDTPVCVIQRVSGCVSTAATVCVGGRACVSVDGRECGGESKVRSKADEEATGASRGDDVTCGEEEEEEENRRMEALAAAFAGENKAVRLLPDDVHRSVRGVDGRKGMAGSWQLFKLNLWRGGISLTREMGMVAVLWMVTIMIDGLVGLLFLRQATTNWRNLIGLAYALVCGTVMNGAFAMVIYLPHDFVSLKREVISGVNTPAPFLFSKLVLMAPVAMAPMVGAGIVYWMTGMRSDTWWGFLAFVAVMGATHVAAFGLGALACSIASDLMLSVSILPALIVPMIIFSGLLYQRGSAPAWLSWMEHISLVNYGFSAILTLQAAHLRSGTSHLILQFIGISDSMNELGKDFMAMFAILFGSGVLSYIALTLRFRYADSVL